MGSPFILAIDPGPSFSGVVEFLGKDILSHARPPNDAVLKMLMMSSYDEIRIERIVLRGNTRNNKAGTETRDTCEWVGRFQQQALVHGNGPVLLVPRIKVLNSLDAANDIEVKGRVASLLGFPDWRTAAGTKKTPGPFFGWSNDEIQALALGLIRV